MSNNIKWLQAGLIIAPVLYLLSLVPWLIIALVLIMGPDDISLLLGLAWLMTGCYPVILIVAVVSGWYFYRQQRYRSSVIAVLGPLPYVLVTLLINQAAIWRAMP